MHIDKEFYSYPDMEMQPVPGGGELLRTQVRGGMLYMYQKVGDCIPAHRHPSGMRHASYIMRGTIRYRQEGQEDVIYNAPAIVVPTDGLEHSFIGETEDAVVINISI